MENGKIQKENIINAYTKDNKTITDIAKEFHLGTKTIRKILKDNNVQIKRNYYKYLDLENLKDYIVNFDEKTTRAKKDMIGKRFGKLTVILRLKNLGTQTVYFCKCDCGNTRVVRAWCLRAGQVSDCGCVSKKIKAQHTKELKTTHGHSRTKLYSVWSSMKGRCFCKTDKHYNNYGGRGITVCDEWKNSFETFEKWASSSGYKEGLTIERINVNGNYEPSNCTWITRHEQCFNKTNSRKIYLQNIGKTAGEWSEIFHLKECNIYAYAKTHNWQLMPYLKLYNIKIEDYFGIQM